MFNIIFEPCGYSPLQVIGLVFFSVFAEIVIDLILAGIIHAMPEKWFSPDNKFFQVDKKERKFYDKINIKKWKDHVLELGAIGGFRKNKLKDSNDTDYLNLFLVESNKGVIIHIANIVLGFLVVFCIPLKNILVISIPVAIVNAFLGLLPIFILRYNTPKLKAALIRAKRKATQSE